MKLWLQKFIRNCGVFFQRLRRRLRQGFARFTRAGGLRGWLSRRVRDIQNRDLRTIVPLGVALLLIVALPIGIAIGKGGKEEPHASTAVMALGEEGIIDLHVQRTPEPIFANVPAPTPLLFARDVKNAQVGSIQLRLMELGYMDPDEPTDLYGPNTEDAVMRFQRSSGLPVDGVLTPLQYDHLMSDEAPPYQVVLGVSGTDVKEIQGRLIELGYLEEGNVTGYFGDVTEAAVKTFQSRNNLSVDGMVGENTYEMLYSEDVVPQSISYGEKSDVVLKIQERLARLGYLTTEPDGNFGRDTVSAVKLFQEKNGLIADGYVGPSTRSTLFSDEAQSNALTIGDSGDSVTRVQEKLVKLGFLKRATGYYGSDTEYAVRAFQKRNGLTGDGKAGRLTIEKLNEDDPHGPSSSYEMPGTSKSSGSSKSSDSAKSTQSGSGSSSSTKAESANDQAGVEKLIAVAKTKKGSKYVKAGKGPNTFDCSGFVYWCLNQAGVKQGYLTSKGWRSVSKYTKIRSMGDIERGDIIVFDGHVAIALDGSNMIHAGSTKGCVYESSFKTDYWKNCFYCAYRIF